jgi:hypothetical protein
MTKHKQSEVHPINRTSNSERLKAKQDKTRQHRTYTARQDRTGQDRTGQDKRRLNEKKTVDITVSTTQLL